MATAMSSSAGRASPASRSRVSSPAAAPGDRRRPLRDRRRQTSACGEPDRWLEPLDLKGIDPADLLELVIHTPKRTLASRCPSRSRRSITDAVRSARRPGDVRVRHRQGRRPQRGHTIHTDRGDIRAPLIVDALGWRRVLGPGDQRSSRRRPGCRAGWRCTLKARGEDLEMWLDRSYVRAGYGWSLAGDEVRVGVGSFDPRFHVKERPCSWPRSSTATRPLPGQLEPPPYPPGHPGRGSSPATPQGTASRRPPRASAQRSTSASRCGGAREVIAGRQTRRRRWRGTAPSAPRIAGSSSGCCGSSD